MIPARFKVVAGTTLVDKVSLSLYLSNFLETPPPKTIKSGCVKKAIYSKNLLSLSPHSLKPKSSFSRTESAQ